VLAHDLVEHPQLVVTERLDRNEELHPSVIELHLDRARGTGVLEYRRLAGVDGPDALPRHGVNDVWAWPLDRHAARVDPQQQTLDGYELAYSGIGADAFRIVAWHHSPADEHRASQLDLRVTPHA
jgi:hypothetical protein